MKKSMIYTRTGDAGKTSLVGGMRVPKTHVRLEAYSCFLYRRIGNFVYLYVFLVYFISEKLSGCSSVGCLKILYPIAATIMLIMGLMILKKQYGR